MPRPFPCIHTQKHCHSKAELLYAAHHLRRYPNNASAWNHLRGLLSPSLLPPDPEFTSTRRRLHALVTEVAAVHITPREGGEGGPGEGWLLARDLLVDLQLSSLPSSLVPPGEERERGGGQQQQKPQAAPSSLHRTPSSPTLLGLVRAKTLVERTLAERDEDVPLLAVRRGYWEVRGGLYFVWCVVCGVIGVGLLTRVCMHALTCYMNIHTYLIHNTLQWKLTQVQTALNARKAALLQEGRKRVKPTINTKINNK